MEQLKRSERGSAITSVGCAALMLGSALLLGSVTCSADETSASAGYQIRGELLKLGDNVSAGRSFGVEGKSVLPSTGIGDREFTLDPAKPKRDDGSAGCPCQGLFADDSGAWSAVSGS